jgi:hypothetical protein
VSGDALLDGLAAAGIHLMRDGDSIWADVEEGADIGPYVARITEHKAALLAALDLRERIIAAATADPPDFDRAAYDGLWRRWHQENPS